MRKTLSVMVITKNEEDRIERCLNSVKDIASEIIVLDSGSEDRTVELVRQYTDKIWVTDWKGYGVQKQRALDKATCEWVLSIDADEEIDQNLKQSILGILSTSNVVEDGFRLPWGNIIFGKRTYFGRAARAPLRLFRRTHSRFTPDIVHEKVVVEGKISKIAKGKLNHYSIRDYGHLLEKTRKYSWLTSQKYYENKKKSYGILLAVFRALFTFIQIYFFRLGVLDGSRGLLLAIVFTQSTFNKYAGLWSREQERL